MLATVFFLGFWVVLAFGLFFVAVRGGPAGAREALQTQSRGGRHSVGLILAIIYIGFGVAIPIAFLTGNHANASSQIGGIRLSAAQKRGRELFGEHCTVCHTLAAANAQGKVGPNLDTLKAPESLVLHTIQYGCLSNPPSQTDPQVCLGQGVMPPNVVQGRDAQDVASFVAKVAGKE